MPGKSTYINERKIPLPCITTALALSLRAATAQERAPEDVRWTRTKLPPASSQRVNLRQGHQSDFDNSCSSATGPSNSAGSCAGHHYAAIKGGKNAKDIVPQKRWSRLVFAVAHVGDDDRSFSHRRREKPCRGR